MASPNLLYGLACAAAFGAGALLAHRAWLGRPMGETARKVVAGAALGVGLAAGLAG